MPLFQVPRFSVIVRPPPPIPYFVNATSGNDSNGGKREREAWQTISKVNGFSFTPGDRVLFKRGETWRERLNPISAGAFGRHIIIDAYGSGDLPIINGADIMTTWTSYAGNTWQKTGVTTEPVQVFMDDTRLIEGADRDSLNDHEWVWAGDVLYVRDDTGDPDGSGVVIEASQRVQCARTHGRDYITLRNLRLTKAQQFGFNTFSAAGDVGLTLENLVLNWNGKTGAFVAGRDDLIVRSCVVHDQDTEHGVYLSGDGPVESALLEDCIIYGNGAHGIQINPNETFRIVAPIIRRNHIYGNASTQINDLGSDGGQYINNLLRNAGADAGTALLYINFEGADAVGAYATRNALIYFNTLVVDAGYRGLEVFKFCTGNVARNNAFHCPDTVVRIIAVRSGNGDEGELDSDYNQLYLSAVANRYLWHGTEANSLAAWTALSGKDSNSDDADLLFVNLANDWHLQTGSPARGAGITLPSVGMDYDRVGRGDPPDIGAYEYVA